MLGDFFRLWGVPLMSRRIGPYRGVVSVFVDGVRRAGDPNDIELASMQQIVLEVGDTVTPPLYAFPVGMDR